MGTAGGAAPRSNLGDGVYRLLWQRILDRRLNPGEKLSDLRLSDELGVSRTPVREALHRLVQDGIVRAEPNRGFYVASFSARDVAEIYDLRATLETMALEAAAPRLTRARLERALADLDRVEAQLRGAVTPEEHTAAAAAFLEVDRAFHRTLVEQAGNSRLHTWVEGLWAQIAVLQQAGTYHPSWTESAIRHHRAIIASLLAGDPTTAARELKRHIQEVKTCVLGDLGTIRRSDGGLPASRTRHRSGRQTSAAHPTVESHRPPRALRRQKVQAEGDAA